RGIAGRDVTEDRARWIGRGLAETLYEGRGPVVVSRDMRLHSPALSAALVQGLRAGGCDVLDIGLAATPMNYWAINHYRGAGGVDAGNGMAGLFMPRLCERYPWLEALPLYWELDGSFPNHEADPLRPENLEPVSALVRERRCDFGAAFDGDADRFVVVDERGE